MGLSESEGFIPGESSEQVPQGGLPPPVVALALRIRLLKLVKKQGRVTKRDVAELLHLDPDGAYYEIRKLVTGGKLVSAKRGPDAYYVKPQMPPIENER